MSKKPYRLLASLLLMLVATLTSCEKFSIDETTGKSREANANVTIHVQKIEGTSLLTTKAADKQIALGDVCSRLTLAIFDGEEKLETVNQLSTDNGFGTAYVSLDEGEYRLVVIAHNGKGNCSVSAPEKVKFASNKLTDTFYYYGRLSVTADGATSDINLSQLHVDFCINLLALCFLPGSLCSHHVGNLHHAFLETEVGASQVLICTGDILHCHVELLLGFLYLKLALGNLQMNLLSRIIQVHLGDIAGSLGGSHLVGSVKPVPYRNMNHHAYVPDSGKLLLETIEYVRVRNHVAAC